jgi:hypothetical protein
LGARLLDSARTATKLAVTTAVLGCTLALTPHQAAADVVYAGKNPVIQQAAQRIAQQVGEPFVHIQAEPAALAAIVANDLLFTAGALDLSLHNPRWLAGGVAIIIFAATRSTIGVIVGGMAAFWLLRAWFSG